MQSCYALLCDGIKLLLVQICATPFAVVVRHSKNIFYDISTYAKTSQLEPKSGK